MPWTEKFSQGVVSTKHVETHPQIQECLLLGTLLCGTSNKGTVPFPPPPLPPFPPPSPAGSRSSGTWRLLIFRVALSVTNATPPRPPPRDSLFDHTSLTCWSAFTELAKIAASVPTFGLTRNAPSRTRKWTFSTRIEADDTSFNIREWRRD